ncbi:MAG: glycosyltransferase family 2 protein [Candidatus Shapirobacteria bacterium]
MPKIAIIILNWNQPELTISTINSIGQITHKNFEYKIVLVSNKPIQLPRTVKTIIYKNNLGYSGGNNLGIKYALKHKYDYVLIANNDIRVSPDFLEKLLFQIKLQPKSIVAPKIYFEKGFEFYKSRYKLSERGHVIWAMGGKIDWQNIYGSNIAIDEVDHGQYDQSPPKPDFISGCCFLVNAHFFQEVGLFDPNYYLYMEDVDLSIRAKQRKYSLIIASQSTIWHINSGTAVASSQIQDYFITRNRLYFTYKYASLRTKFAIFRESIKHIIVGRTWQKIGVRDFYLSKLGKGSWV